MTEKGMPDGLTYLSRVCAWGSEQCAQIAENESGWFFYLLFNWPLEARARAARPVRRVDVARRRLAAHRRGIPEAPETTSGPAATRLKPPPPPVGGDFGPDSGAVAASVDAFPRAAPDVPPGTADMMDP